MAWTSREAVLEQYGLQEASLDQLEQSALFGTVQQTKLRNRVGYELTPETDFVFRVAKTALKEVTNDKLRRLPMHRAVLALCLSEGPAQAAGILSRRMVIKMTAKEAQARWKLFEKNIPAEAKAEFATEVGATEGAARSVLRFLSIEEAYDNPAMLTQFNAIFDRPKLRGLLDGLLFHHANYELTAKCLNALFFTKLTPELLQMYRQYYFDTYDLSLEDMAFYLHEFRRAPDYYTTLSKAVSVPTLFEFVSIMKLDQEMEAQQYLRYILRECRSDLVQVRAGELSQNRFNNAAKTAIAASTLLQSHQAIEAAKAVGTGAESSDIPGLIALKHDMEANQKMLHDLAEIPSADRDPIAAGPVSVAKSNADGDAA